MTNRESLKKKEALKFVREIHKNLIPSPLDLSEIIGVGGRTVYRWVSENSNSISPLSVERITDVYQIFQILFDTLTEDAVKSWLYRFNEYLDECPIDLLKRKDYKPVYSLAVDLKYNTYP